MEFLQEVAPAKSGDQFTTPIYRSKIFNGELVTEHEGCRNIYDLFQLGCRKYTSQKLQGQRTKLSDGSLGDYKWLNYNEVKAAVDAVFRSLKLQGCSEGSKIGIYGTNSVEWTQAMFACSYLSAVCVPMYDTLGADSVIYVTEHSEMEFIFVGEKNCEALSQVVKSLGDKSGQIREICIWSDYSNVDGNELSTCIQVFESFGIQVERWEDFVRKGKSEVAQAIKEPIPPRDPEAIAVLMYTSGTTGVPKGVAISHRAICASVASGLFIEDKIKLGIQGGVHLSWLPLAHIFGFVIEIAAMVGGACIGYWQGKTDKLLDDISTLRPTALFGVPRIWNRIVERANQRINNRGFVVKQIFEYAYSCKKLLLESGYNESYTGSFLDNYLFYRVKNTLGGRLTFAASGAAPLPPHTEEFLRVTLTVPFLQGYGLTETCGLSMSTLPYRHDLSGTVGVIHPSIELRLESVPELGYLVDGDFPAGEVCLRGPALFTEYYKNPEEYHGVIDEDGFFHTGDIGKLLPSGALQIVDRKKNIFKLAQGEYVAVEKIETCLQKATSVSQIWVYGDSQQRFLVAVVHPNKEELDSRFEGDTSLEDLCRSEQVKKEILDELTEAANAGKLNGFEKVRDIALVPEEFTIENGLVTPSHKLKRHDLLKRYKNIVDAMYSKEQA